MSRGYGAPDNQSASSPLSRPDWGWGDAPPSPWDSAGSDYGWGSDHGSSFPSYLDLVTREIGDDGGYEIMIKGDFPRRGASLRQRPSGFSVVLVAGGSESPCHSGLFGQGVSCSTDLRARELRAYSPRLATGTHTVRVRYDGTEEDVGSISVYRSSRSRSAYALANTFPSAYATGPRTLESEPLLSGLATDTQSSTLRTLIHAFGQSLDSFGGRGAVTRLTAASSIGDSSLTVESTLGFADQGSLWIDGERYAYTGRTSTQFTGLDIPQTHNVGSAVSYDPHAN